MSLILQLAFKYFKSTSPLLMLWHLVWTICIVSILLVTYVVTFNFLPVIDMWQNQNSKMNYSRELKTTVFVDNAVNSTLNKLLDDTGATRAFVFRYHNGTPSPDNVPFLFFTNTHEIIRPGANRLLNMSQHLPASLIHNENLEFLANKCVVLNDLNKDTNSANYWIYQTRASIATIRCPFFSQKGDLIGFVGVDYTETTPQAKVNASADVVKKTADHLTEVYALR